MPKRSVPTWLVLLFVPVGLILLIPALWVFVSVTATPVHPSPESVPTTLHSAPLPEWSGAAERGRQAVRASVAEQNLPGLSVAVGVDGDLVWAEGFGYADLKSSEPVTPKHRFRIGTASMALTSAGAGLLLEDGRLKLADEIQRYVPAYPKKQWPVTLRQLMGHTAGIVDDGEPHFTKHCERPAEALPSFADRPLLFQPGTQYRYSSDGWVLMSAAVEAAAGEPFRVFMRDRVFRPLGMRDTVADPGLDPEVVEGEDFPPVTMVRELIYDPEAKRDTRADSARRPMQTQVTPYFTRFRSDPNYGMHLMRPLDSSCSAGAGVFVSTPSDLVRFGMAIQGGKLLKPDTVDLLQAQQRLASGAETGAGLGWHVRTVTLGGKPTRVIGHDGDSLGGTVASLMTFPEYGIVVAVTSNIPYSDTPAIGLRVAESFVDQGRIRARK